MIPIELLDPFALDTLVVMPIRSFAFAKQRLGETLTNDARRTLARTLAERVAAAAGRISVLVISSDVEVTTWAQNRLAFSIADPGSLSTAAAAGRTWAAEHGLSRCIIAHADLAFADDFERVIRPGFPTRALIVPDRFDDGTPVMSLPTAGPFEFAYGPGSFGIHCAAARDAGFDVEILRDRLLGFDVDEPADIEIMDHGPNYR